jgi:hypothetical protein
MQMELPMTRARTAVNIVLFVLIACVSAAIFAFFFVEGRNLRAAEANPTRLRWEQWCSYKDADSDGGEKAINHELQVKGLDGWELAGISVQTSTLMTARFYYCVKRPIP